MHKTAHWCLWILISRLKLTADFSKTFGISRPFSGNMILDDLDCFGNESSLAECPHSPWGEHDCHNTNELAGVRCHILPTPRVRYPPWNPLGLQDIRKKHALWMQKVTLKLHRNTVHQALGVIEKVCNPRPTSLRFKYSSPSHNSHSSLLPSVVVVRGTTVQSWIIWFC